MSPSACDVTFTLGIFATISRPLPVNLSQGVFHVVDLETTWALETPDSEEQAVKRDFLHL